MDQRRKSNYESFLEIMNRFPSPPTSEPPPLAGHRTRFSLPIQSARALPRFNPRRSLQALIQPSASEAAGPSSPSGERPKRTGIRLALVTSRLSPRRSLPSLLGPLSENTPTDSFARDKLDLGRRYCTESLATEELDTLWGYLFSLSGPELVRFQQLVQAEVAGTPRWQSEQSGLIECNRYRIDFRLPQKTVATGILLIDSVEIALKGGGQCRYELVSPPSNPDYLLNVSPTSGKLKALKGSELITFKVLCHAPCKVRQVVTLRVEGGPSHWFLVGLEAEGETRPPSALPEETSGLINEPRQLSLSFDVFRDPSRLVRSCVFVGHPHEIPGELAVLSKTLTREPSYLRAEGLFYDNGDVTEVRRLLEGKGTYRSHDCFATATAIKRMLQVHPLLQPLASEVVAGCQGEGDVMSVLSLLPPRYQDWLLWVVDLMIAVGDARAGQSGISSVAAYKGVAAAMIPSLCKPGGPPRQDTQHIAVVQRAAEFLYLAMIVRARQTEPRRLCLDA
ncbi:uncharacterized protein BJ171DRAFT_484443 [Polychytrium aggregatum]|uniref:uncharacterized protein n=1 Tax=Polychytrium aggregatum TaxID=110093 RepID=UPI0022FE5877|nr:uncharacterized protein BJ171DRAFT_484443 [Polychytrium aggregatum]KAI9209571.1 hypothetical protein BJ171DRAFT_484443 [Polychytrium aggregatum]